MTPKQIKKATEIWNDRSSYFNLLFLGNARVREETGGWDFRKQLVCLGDPVLVASLGTGEIYQGIIWKIMGFKSNGRNYFIFVPKLGRVLVRASSYIARDISV